MSDPKRETITEKLSGGATRRELFHIGNVLALPVLMSAFEADAAPAPGPLKTGPEWRSINRSALNRSSIAAARSPSSAHPSNCPRFGPPWTPPANTTYNWTSWRTRSGGGWQS